MSEQPGPSCFPVVFFSFLLICLAHLVVLRPFDEDEPLKKIINPNCFNQTPFQPGLNTFYNLTTRQTVNVTPANPMEAMMASTGHMLGNLAKGVVEGATLMLSAIMP